MCWVLILGARLQMCWGLASKLNTMVQYIALYSLCSRFGSSDTCLFFHCQSLAMAPRQIQQHTYCRMCTGAMVNVEAPSSGAVNGKVNAHLKNSNSSCKAQIYENELILWGPPLEISDAYLMVVSFLRNELQMEVQLLRRTTTTTKDYDHELRTTTTTNYDCDEIRLRRLQ